MSPSGLVYTLANLSEISTDPFYLITLDFITTQISRFSGLQPTKVEQSRKGSIIYYRLQYSLSDGSKWEIIANIDTNTVIISLEKETEVSQASKPI